MATGRTWPPSLPQYPIQQGYEDAAPSRLKRTAMDAGPPKVRRRPSLGTRKRTMVFIMNGTQLAALETFVTSTLGDGALRFDMTHPVSRVAEEVRIVPQSEDKLYVSTPAGELWYNVSIILEVMP